MDAVGVPDHIQLDFEDTPNRNNFNDNPDYPAPSEFLDPLDPDYYGQLPKPGDDDEKVNHTQNFLIFKSNM